MHIRGAQEAAGTGDSGEPFLWAPRGESHEEPRVSRAARPRLPLAHGYTGRLVPERLASWPWRPYTMEREWRGSWGAASPRK